VVCDLAGRGSLLEVAVMTENMAQQMMVNAMVILAEAQQMRTQRRNNWEMTRVTQTRLGQYFGTDVTIRTLS